MATTAQIDAALTVLRSARANFAGAVDVRARALLVRDNAIRELTDANAAAISARDAVNAAKDTVRTLLSEPEV